VQLRALVTLWLDKSITGNALYPLFPPSFSSVASSKTLNPYAGHSMIVLNSDKLCTEQINVASH